MTQICRRFSRYSLVVFLSFLLVGGSFLNSLGRVHGTLAPKSVTRKSVPESQAEAAKRDGEILIRFRAATDEQQKDGVASSIGARRKKQLRGDSSIEKLELTAGQDLQTKALQLMLDQRVEFAEPNFLIRQDQISPIIPDDSRFHEQWALQNRGENGGQFGSDVGVTMAWHTTTESQNTVIAVIDSGVDFTHPDLANNEWTNSNPINNDPHGWDFVTDTGVIKDEQATGRLLRGSLRDKVTTRSASRV